MAQQQLEVSAVMDGWHGWSSLAYCAVGGVNDCGSSRAGCKVYW